MKHYLNSLMPATGEVRGKHEFLLTSILLIWTFLGALIPNVWLSVADHMPVLSAMVNIVLPAGIYLLLLSATRRIGVTSLCFVVLFVFAAFQMVLLYMYGQSIIAVDMFLNVVTTNSNEVGELLGNLTTIITTIVIIFLPPIILAIISLSRHYYLNKIVQKGVRKVGIITTSAGLVLLGACYLFNSKPYRMHCDLYPVNIGYNLKEAVNRTMKVSHYRYNVANVKYPVTETHPDSVPETYVLVIGETSRADNWQLNGYDRETSPKLMNREGLVNFPKALTQSNTTHKSVPMLLSHLNARTFGDSIYYTKSLITAFNEAGYKTSFFTAQNRNRSFIDFFGEEADTCVFIKDNLHADSIYYDTDLLKYLDSALSDGHRKRLIVLHMYGSHFNYIDRYPREMAKFLPDGPADGTPEYREKLINAYDNTTLLTSELLTGIMDRLSKVEGLAAMIYTSDHGEDIFDDDRQLFLHASPVPSYYQVHVPFMVWLNEAYTSADAAKADALKGNSGKFVASSDAVYHTLTDIAGLRTPYLKENSALTSASYVPDSVIYLNDHNQGIPLKDSGILRQDFEKLDSLGVRY